MIRRCQLFSVFDYTKLTFTSRIIVGKLSTNACPALKAEEVEVSFENAKPFKEIPKPSMLSFLPGGKLYNLSLIELHKTLRAEYGDLIHIPGLFKAPSMILSYDPKDFEKIFRAEGNMPVRRGLQTLAHYRQNGPDLFKKAGGLATENGEFWHSTRTIVNPVLMQPKTVRLYVTRIEEIADEFISNMKLKLDSKNELPDNFLGELNRWSLESIGYIALDRRLNVISDEKQDERSKKMIRLVRELFELGFEHDVLPSMWRIYKTPSFKRLMKVYDDLTTLALEYIEETMERFKENPTLDENNMGVLEKLLLKNKDVAVVMAIDLLIAGVDTTSSAFSGIFYCLAKNPDKQAKLREEIKKILPEKSSRLTAETMKNMPYLRACIKEGIRLYPATVGTMRAPNADLVCQGYQIPKDTDVVVCTMALQNSDVYYQDSDKFIPERWLKNVELEEGCPQHAKNSNPFSYLPFGFGSRMCIGRRFAEMEIEVLLLRLLREFNVEWHYPDLQFKSVLINIPDAPLKFRLNPLK